jgi:hypothetical protein
MDAKYSFGQYEVPAAMALETKRIDWMSVKNEQKNMKILAGDVALKCIVPILRGPGPGEANDGSTNNPPGYPELRTARMKPRIGFDASEMVPGVER